MQNRGRHTTSSCMGIAVNTWEWHIKCGRLLVLNTNANKVAGQERLWNPCKVHYRAPAVIIVNQLNQVDVVTPYMYVLSQCFLSLYFRFFSFLANIWWEIFGLPRMCYLPARIFFYFPTLCLTHLIFKLFSLIFGEEYKLGISSLCTSHKPVPSSRHITC